jgi:large subunit ribosomal protein L22
MQVASTYRFARVSAFKARDVTREIQGRSASDALDLLAFSPKKAAVLVQKTLKSAIANAENNAELKVDTLLVKEAVVGEGPTLKRFRARARGGASPILKRTSHIRIVLSDELALKIQSEKVKKKGAKGRDSSPKSAVPGPAQRSDAAKSSRSARRSDATATTASDSEGAVPPSAAKPAEQKE